MPQLVNKTNKPKSHRSWLLIFFVVSIQSSFYDPISQPISFIPLRYIWLKAFPLITVRSKIYKITITLSLCRILSHFTEFEQCTYNYPQIVSRANIFPITFSLYFFLTNWKRRQHPLPIWNSNTLHPTNSSGICHITFCPN